MKGTRAAGRSRRLTIEAECICPALYNDLYGDGTLCLDTDQCNTGEAACDVNASCVDIEDGPEGAAYLCSCNTGYEGDGFTCTDIDGCADAPCYAGVSCMDISAPGTGFACGPCPDVFSGDGITCTGIDGCADAFGGGDLNWSPMTSALFPNSPVSPGFDS